MGNVRGWTTSGAPYWLGGPRSILAYMVGPQLSISLCEHCNINLYQMFFTLSYAIMCKIECIAVAANCSTSKWNVILCLTKPQII